MNGEDGRTRMGTIERSLALAVDLRDGAAGGRPKGSPSVSLSDRPETFTRTPSGFHVISDLPGDVDEVTVVVDGGDAHLSERRTVELDEDDRSTPETFELLPSPAYPFGGGVTLVRGFVTDARDAPVARATVTIRDRDESTRTTTDGEYALWLRSIDGENVTSDETIEVGGETPDVEAIHPDDETTTTTASTEISVGATARQDLTFPQ